jgi:alpha-tubulin suppressor-like RCC1 family protein
VGGCGRDGIKCPTLDCGQANAPPGKFSAISAGANNTCGLRDTGEIDCWGLNDYGQTAAPAGFFTDVSVGADLSCGLRSTGAVECWGRNDFGQASPPSEVMFQVLAVASTYACGIDTERHAHCWGQMQAGAVPTDRFTRLVARDWLACGITEAGQIRCWGSEPKTASSPAGFGFSDVTISDEDVCGVDTQGKIDCWGYQLRFAESVRDGDLIVTSPPATEAAVRVGAGPSALCMLDHKGKVTCFATRSLGMIAPTDTFDLGL